MTAEIIEKFAIRAALGNNGGTWADHYTEAQREHWRRFVRELMHDMQIAQYDSELKRGLVSRDELLRELANMDDLDHQVEPKL